MLPQGDLTLIQLKEIPSLAWILDISPGGGGGGGSGGLPEEQPKGKGKGESKSKSGNQVQNPLLQNPLFQNPLLQNPMDWPAKAAAQPPYGGPQPGYQAPQVLAQQQPQGMERLQWGLVQLKLE